MWRRILPWAPSIFALLLLAVPFVSHAAGFITIIPKGGACTCTGQDADHIAPDFGCVLQIIQAVISDISVFATAILTVFIAWAGFTYIMSPTSEEKRRQANQRITNAIIGLMIVLTAWLLIDTIMKVVYNNGSGWGPWNQILTKGDTGDCIQHSTAGAFNVGAIVSQFGSGNASGNGGVVIGKTASGGQCAVRTSGSCSVENLTPYFGSAATSFSKICTHESAGGAMLNSTTDLTRDNKPVSFGLFQLNISAHQINGLPCPSAFNKPLTAASLRDKSVFILPGKENLYNQCKQAAIDPNTNIQFAANLYKSEGFSPWKADAICGLSG